MSKPARLFYFPALMAILHLSAVVVSTASEHGAGPEKGIVIASIRIEPRSENPDGKPVVVITGSFLGERTPANRRNFSFLSSFAGFGGLANRISNIKLQDAKGVDLQFKELVKGEYLADGEIKSWSYTIDLTVPTDFRAAAHVSWLADDVGVLMLNDLLPHSGDGNKPVWLSVEVPLGWSVVSPKALEPSPSNLILKSGAWYEPASDSVILVGRSWRATRTSESPKVDLALSGEWQFGDADAGNFVREILAEYAKAFGPAPFSNVQIAIARFPRQIRHGEWQAETRGHSVTIISSDMPFKTQSLQRLHEQLRHELFHLWIPNGVNLTGNYDWFYEGFALYQSLKLAVGLNRIRFEDFLDTLSRAHTIDSAGSQRNSLIQASATRFGGANTQVYARGMLVAFLSDLALLQESKGKRSVENILKDLFAKHRKPAPPADGNATILALMKADNKLAHIAERYVIGTEKIDWAADLAASGIADIDNGPITTLRVKEQLGGRQKTILDKLGYNNWRKLSRDSR